MMAQFKPFELNPVPVFQPWEAFTLPLEGFPLPEDQREDLRAWIGQLVSSLALQHRQIMPATWIEMSQIHHDNGARVLAANARAWKPDMGLGIYPDRESPRLWTKSDFLDRAWDEALPDFMLTVSHVADQQSTEHARDTMLGRGVVTHLLLEKPADAFHAEARAFLLPRIREEAFRCYPFYLPLLRRSSVEKVDPQVLFQWLGCAAVYIRECFDDKEILLLSRIPLEAHFKAIGMRRTSATAELSSWSYHQNAAAGLSQTKIM
jgi:hypothetical protein